MHTCAHTHKHMRMDRWDDKQEARYTVHSVTSALNRLQEEISWCTNNESMSRLQRLEPAWRTKWVSSELAYSTQWDPALKQNKVSHLWCMLLEKEHSDTGDWIAADCGTTAMPLTAKEPAIHNSSERWKVQEETGTQIYHFNHLQSMKVQKPRKGCSGPLSVVERGRKTWKWGRRSPCSMEHGF